MPRDLSLSVSHNRNTVVLTVSCAQGRMRVTWHTATPTRLSAAARTAAARLTPKANHPEKRDSPVSAEKGNSLFAGEWDGVTEAGSQ